MKLTLLEIEQKFTPFTKDELLSIKGEKELSCEMIN